MRVLLFSDVHRDIKACEALVAQARGVDLVLGCGDYASHHDGLEPTIAALRPITTPIVLVPGNNERSTDLRAACAGWANARVLHEGEAEVLGLRIVGFGGGVPAIGQAWSHDYSEQQAAAALARFARADILVLHSPPLGFGDETSDGRHRGSTAVLAAIERLGPRLAGCGHIHDSWGWKGTVGATVLVNAGPRGRVVEV